MKINETTSSAETDFSLIQENLKLTPTERLEQLEQLANDLAELRAAAKSAKASS